MLRRVWAFLLAPFPAALFQSIVVALWPKQEGIFAHPASMFVAICIYYYAFGVLLGTPAWLVLRRRQAMTLGSCAIVGLLVGLLPAGLALAWTIMQGQASAYVVAYDSIFFALGGMAAGATFWLVTRDSRSDGVLNRVKA